MQVLESISQDIGGGPGGWDSNKKESNNVSMTMTAKPTLKLEMKKGPVSNKSSNALNSKI